MRSKILKVMKNIETEFGVRILFACESGSRAWGFASRDSDYDVRFIYMHPVEWYLSINVERKRDVIELPIEDDLDINGWDMRKALNLFRKSNPPLLEWIGSPIVYLEQHSFIEQLRTIVPDCYSPLACMYHYYKMARGNYRDYLQGEEVWLKKYFYVLRPLLAVNWLERELGVVPTEFQVLVDAVVETGRLKQEIERLKSAKQAGKELDKGPRIAVISDFIDQELARIEEKVFDKNAGRCPIEKLDAVFVKTLSQVWGHENLSCE